MIRSKHVEDEAILANNYMRGKKWSVEKQKLEDVEVTDKGLLKFILKQLCVISKLLVGVRGNTNLNSETYIGDPNDRPLK